MLASISAGILIMFFEFVEMMVIGSPPGRAQFMQLFYFALGVAIATPLSRAG